MRTVLVQNGVVVNIIMSTTEHNQNIENDYEYIQVINDNSSIKIGATWDGTTFTNPVEEPED